ncbi:MAG: TonB-dependent siderophore receptor [Proteobacteria bacterium]|uniref:TonB-dependent receptor n=1 Tax=Aquabacterium sp. TaxID=1872578 RepID=UPI0035C71C1A|nr:TonB-dependent siderophore receptor [Pseudomonadota bacterium]
MHHHSPKDTLSATTQAHASPTAPSLGALAAGVGLSLLGATAMAQTAPSASAEATLPAVTVTETSNKPEAKTTYQATTTTIGKGKQALRDIPQSITVVTEKLMADRNLDTMKDVLRQTAGITFQAAEGGEEDIRLRGFSLQTTGDIFMDGVRDPAIYDRDTFNLDRLELLRGSASMLFGRGSTGGAVNQVSKAPYLGSASEVNVTAGNHDYKRVTGDFNIQTADDAALRITGMRTQANNNGAGSSIDKHGVAASYRWGIGKKVEHQVSVFHIDNDNGINYGLPWIKPRSTDSQGAQRINSNLDPANYYGMASDYNRTQGDVFTYMNTVKLGGGSELKTVVRKGDFQRDLRASTIRLASATSGLSNFSGATAFTRGSQVKIQNMDLLQLQTDYSGKHQILGMKHEITTGIDFSRENRVVLANGSTIAKPNTTAGNPNDGATIDEASRILRRGNQFSAKGVGTYVQDLVHIAPMWKVLGGLRYDYFNGDYTTFNNNTANLQSANYKQSINKLSKRAGVLFQPSALDSYHLSYGTSFNTSGDTYSYNALSANTPPESSENIELGAKLDSEDGRVTTRLALFRATKLNERNTDPDNAATRLLLSGKRHATGFDMDVTGQITEAWDIYASYTWIPEARVDEAAPTVTGGGSRKGDRPGLTPRHSGTVWNTYKFMPQWRAGVGVNFRSKQAPADITAPANGIYNAPGFATLDLMAEYALNKVYTVKANVTNVANKVYADQVYRGFYVPGAGRLVQVTLSAKF